ncbi:ventrally expressed dharma/bozozok antagonist [Acanthochromis polyacanthus]|uniref:ventrally expressed dharma/bozozok antagonist n=1 Tax=Acanthochromis polyacanthus TaxID=80966 RepID=UPI00223452EF|nr:ventrally expressed dharma/bozozok antagonist [Acanthochromis polyacanthus]
MRSHFSIEWMAQSSQSAGSETPAIAASGPAAWGTHSESLPGFYCRPKPENVYEQQQQQSHEAQSQNFVQQQICPKNQAATEADFSSGTEEETSGYESEGGQSLSPPSECPSTSPPSPPVGRRPRTAFTAEQISSLETAFKRNPYLGTQDKAELCKTLNLSDKQIRNWFQNRRMKLKRTAQDALAHACQANVASQFMHYHELQAYRLGPYTRYHSAAGPAGATEGLPAAASFAHPHSLQYSSALPLDSFYQYSSRPGVMLPSATSQLRGSYTTYPQYY